MEVKTMGFTAMGVTIIGFTIIGFTRKIRKIGKRRKIRKRREPTQSTVKGATFFTPFRGCFRGCHPSEGATLFGSRAIVIARSRATKQSLVKGGTLFLVVDVLKMGV